MVCKYLVEHVDVANLAQFVGSKTLMHFAVHKHDLGLFHRLVDDNVASVWEDVHNPSVWDVLIRHLAGTRRRCRNGGFQTRNLRIGRVDSLTS